MNMLALRYGDNILVIDAGMMFPEAELLGVDVVIPDITYLKQNRAMVRGIVLTLKLNDNSALAKLPRLLRAIGDAGNLRVVRRGSDTAPRLIVGSHLDTVIHAGAFDGILGVVMGVALIDDGAFGRRTR